VTVALMLVWAIALGMASDWNPAMVIAGALLGFAIGGG
jgi:hypothetical protein